MSKQAEVIRELLQADVKLCSLSDIGSHRVFDFTLPTLTTPSRFTDRHTFASDDSFMELLQKVNEGAPYEILSKAGACSKDNSIVLFGGCLLDVLFKRSDQIKDFDLRLVGPEYMDNEAKCVEKAKAFVASVFDYMLEQNKRIDQKIERAKNSEESTSTATTYEGERYDISEVTVSRRKSTVTIHIPGRRTFMRKLQKSMCFQLTFAPTATIEDMLAACLPHASRLAIFNEAVVLDQMARYCIESTCVILNTSDFRNFYVEADDASDPQWSGRVLATQLPRYIKYFTDKGFDIVLPDLDMANMPRRNLKYGVSEVLALPQLVVVYGLISGDNKIMAEDLSIADGYAIGDAIGEYDQNPEYDVGNAIHHSIRCLVAGVLDQFKYVAKGEVWDEVFDFVPTLTPRMVDKSYETVETSLRSGTLDLQKVTGYFSETPPHDVISKLLVAPLKEEAMKRKTLGQLPSPFKVDFGSARELVQKEKAGLLLKIEGLRDELKSKGLDLLVVPYPENVSTEADLFKALYGEYGVKP